MDKTAASPNCVQLQTNTQKDQLTYRFRGCDALLSLMSLIQGVRGKESNVLYSSFSAKHRDPSGKSNVEFRPCRGVYGLKIFCLLIVATVFL